MKLRSVLMGLAATLALSACEMVPTINEQPSKSVNVLSRTWAVTQVSEAPVIYRATRDTNNLNPFGPPARMRTTQAIAAVQQATGCNVIRSSMYQNISGQFYTQVACK
ncbi:MULTISPECIES: hypothetical protein [Roseobacteraceae]|nr:MULTISPECIES: hypothetical protein [Roseobacteraceae]